MGVEAPSNLNPSLANEVFNPQKALQYAQDLVKRQKDEDEEENE